MSRSRFIGWSLVLLTLLVYLPVVRNGFLNLDDPDYVTENPMVQRGLTWAGVQWAFTSWHASNWHPLTWLSHMADCDLFRLNPAGHHLVNLWFHTANAWLLFRLWWRLTSALWPSAMIAALFAWHPLHVESVAWVAERKDVLGTFFALLALLSYVRYVQNNMARGSWWLALLFFALGLMSKSMLVTLPCVFLLLDFWPLQRNQPIRLLREKWPFFLLSCASCVVTVLSQRAEAIAPLVKYSLGLRVENIVTAYVKYLYKTIWPAKLAVFYPLIPPAGPAVILSAAALTVISIGVWRAKSQPYLLMGWLWYLGTLVPVIGWVQVGDQALADRYTYFPLTGIFLAGVWAVKNWAKKFRYSNRWLTGAAGLTLVACVGGAENQLRYWRDSETLFRHALAVTPDNATARLNLGAALQAENRPTEALEQYMQALELDKRPEVYHNIGRLLNDAGRAAEAEFYCRRAVDLNPRSALSHNGLGVVLAELQRYPEARQEFSIAARLDPGLAAPHFQAGRTWLKTGQDTNAVAEFHEALRLEPDNVNMLIYIARVLAADPNPLVRDGPRALELAQQAAQLAGGQPPVVLDTLAMACAETRHFNAAVQLACQAMAAAQANGSQDDYTNIQQRLERYRRQQPARISFAK